MSSSPIICFGQQPCGFFLRRFLFAKILTARRLQTEIGGEIVFFYHDSDHDPRETKTILRQRQTNEPATLNFAFDNKIQRKFSPLYIKRIAADWHGKTLLQLTNYVERPAIEVFEKVNEPIVSDFCLEMYRRMGLLEGIRIERSGDPAFRRAACDAGECFVDVTHEGEIVRARLDGNTLKLHEGGDKFITLPMTQFSKEQISPARDSRFRWMQSVLHCTHYVAGLGEQAYLQKTDASDVTFVPRDNIDRSDEAYTDIPA